MLRLILGLITGFALGAYFSRQMEDGELRDRITEMQARAIFEAAAEVQRKGIKVRPEIMIPLVGFP
ncbi:MAG: hypothetical protein C4289_09625, partial [Chloroflexota bacterium]